MTIQGNTVTRDIKVDSKFIYCDDDATPSAIMLENDEYLLVRNLQGDVVAVVNAANGETVVEFSYDPWGNVTRKYSETYTDGATEEELKLLDLVMSALCPVTYRGYNYDFTTGLYYLQSRYYNPEWGRFLNTDDTSIMLTKTDDAFSANMYLYCNNNPVNKVDYDGYNAHDGSDYKVRVNIYNGVAGHSELVIARNMICSYGIYGEHSLIDNVAGTQGRLLLIYNEYKWYLYDKEQNNRGRTGYTFYLSKSNYIKVLIYYIAIILQSDIEPSDLGYIDKCTVKEGKYTTYKVLETNCTTIIRDALLFGAPEVVLRACYMSGLSFSGFTEVFKPSLLKPYVEAIGKYC